MLAYILALAVGLGSLGIFLAAFFLPELHRKNDILWSGVGLFYALVLWVCAGRITGGVLLGQLASVTLLGWAVSQTLSLRRELTPAGQKTPIPESLQGGSWGSRLQGFISGVKSKLPGGKAPQSTPVPPPAPKVETPAAPVTETIVMTPQTSETSETVEIASEAVSPAPEVTETDSVEVDTSTVGELVEVTEEVTVAEAIAEGLPGMDGEASSASIELDVASDSPASDSPVSDSSEETTAETVEASLEPVHPHPPSPELVEAAVEDAEEKHLPSDPPPTTDEVEQGTDSSSDRDDDDWV